jgi:SAM-dependent methyltransferase
LPTSQSTDDGDQIHILPVSLLDSEADLKEEFLEISRRLHLELGWHYLLDLTWSADQLSRSHIPVAAVLDAGAGTGVMQWWMASQNLSVTSVDRVPRHFSRRMRGWTRVEGDVVALPSVRRSALERLANGHGGSARRRMRAVPGALRDLALGEPAAGSVGRIMVVHADLIDLGFIGTETLDAVVSISSLEHNAIEVLPKVVTELMRVLKPGGRLIATVGAATESDWFHAPSSGWCFTEQSIRSVFGLDEACISNFADHDRLLGQLRGCDELRRDLARFYFRSGANGMPWGRWNPQYQPVGIVKVKADGDLRATETPSG